MTLMSKFIDDQYVDVQLYERPVYRFSVVSKTSTFTFSSIDDVQLYWASSTSMYSLIDDQNIKVQCFRQLEIKLFISFFCIYAGISTAAQYIIFCDKINNFCLRLVLYNPKHVKQQCPTTLSRS